MRYAASKNRYIQILILILIGAVFYIFFGQEWMVLERDSPFYLDASTRMAGVMPIYPFFLSVVKCIFGEAVYLNAAVVIQSVIAILFTMIFVLYLQYTFRLKFIETILFYIAAMLPFSIELPRVCATHQIMTESLAFPFFYIFFIFLIQYMFCGKRKWICLTAGMAVFMALIRSQLLLLIIITAIFFVCMEFAKDKKNRDIKRWIKAGLNLLLCVVITYLLVLFVYKVKESYYVYVLPTFNNRSQNTEVEVSERETEEKENVLVAGTEEIANVSTTETEKIEYRETMSQMTDLIIIRGFYEADEEDVVLFDTPEMQEIFRRVYDEVDKKGYRYEYAEPGLYMWRDLVNDKIVPAAAEGINNYLNENSETQINKQEVMKELGLKVLLKHLDRYIYHTFRLMIVGFISCIFFQIEKIYLLCHLITLFLFVFSIWGMLYCIKYKGEKNVVVFAGMAVGFICLLVGVITLVFVPLQRYMVYAMGIFYCSLYLLMKETVLITAKRFPDNRVLAAAANILE